MIAHVARYWPFRLGNDVCVEVCVAVGIFGSSVHSRVRDPVDAVVAR